MQHQVIERLGYQNTVGGEGSRGGGSETGHREEGAGRHLRAGPGGTPAPDCPPSHLPHEAIDLGLPAVDAPGLLSPRVQGLLTAGCLRGDVAGFPLSAPLATVHSHFHLAASRPACPGPSKPPDHISRIFPSFHVFGEASRAPCRAPDTAVPTCGGRGTEGNAPFTPLGSLYFPANVYLKIICGHIRTGCAAHCVLAELLLSLGAGWA